ncbi:Tfp pilus assembly protein PilP [Mizugakiibacter sediminis]|uniref:Pilus assembly protein PilP n=1 Tax=Mizugakiibacter sediminis TaxID=1475481 RepID=A0A0K8QML4_9GAMM|nr:pilus assembly protein PilP [Mizugakiibacter sediminis]GAP66113.1 Tfp pilus assembly protein PilP [Mizugakiibacter sediminis]
MKRTLARILIGTAALALLAGCSGQGDLRQWVAAEKAKKGAPLPPLPVIKTFETFEYQDQDLRDPFSPSPTELHAGGAVNGPQPDQNRAKEPLEAFPLDSLKMVGTLGGGAGMEALIKDPQGVIHRIHAGNYMGQNYGRVADVAEDHVDLVELIPNGNGGWMERQATIALGEK